jgi:hypothetical protein
MTRFAAWFLALVLVIPIAATATACSPDASADKRDGSRTKEQRDAGVPDAPPKKKEGDKGKDKGSGGGDRKGSGASHGAPPPRDYR